MPWRECVDRSVKKLLPSTCALCGAEAGEEPVCAPCSAGLPTAVTACPACALPLAEAGVSCGACQREPAAFDATVAAFTYRFPVDRLVQALKYSGRLALAGWFAERLAVAPPAAERVVLLPMPLHPARLRTRGFNQSAEIARPLARAWGVPLELDAVRRVRDTRPQAALPWSARRVNMRGAFRCERSFAGVCVVVVDDVMTTGATLDELARVLKAHGAARVENRIVARTP